MALQATTAEDGGSKRVELGRPPRRVSARFTGAVTQSGIEARTRERVDLRAQTLALFELEAALYSVEVARALRCSVSRAVSYLRRLERDGALVSTKEPSPLSGQGRRVYRRSTPHAGRLGTVSPLNQSSCSPGFETARASSDATSAPGRKVESTSRYISPRASSA